MHYYQFNIADYRKDTQHLTPVEHYIYRELMDWYYLDETPIPRKTQLVLRRLRLVSENNQELTNVLEEYFIDTEEGWVHGRIEKEISVYQAKADTARVNGSKGGRPKKPRKTQLVKNRNPEKTGSKANHKPITNNQEPSKESRRFTRPSPQEIENYIFEKTGGHDKSEALKIFNFYESNGWKVGKNPMKNWKAAVSNWLTRNQSDAKRQTTANDRRQQIADATYGPDALNF